MRGGELVTADEPTAVSKPLPDSVVVEDSQSNGCFSDSSCADEGDRNEIFCETDDILDQLVAPETGPWWRGRQLSRRDSMLR